MKNKKFVVDTVKSDLKEAAEWYNNAKKGLGLIFLREINQNVNNIANNPLIHNIRYSNIRIAFCTKFPYGIHYEYLPEQNQVNILAIYHTSRNPDLWKDSDI
ncbi:type II toxin-antitoxin system RelE/ParE family toxin [Flavobacterium sp. Sd200]|uniref:type II toxin-antitoxin system RelE/ParE family toxin n=1 Tax=Flavobacterium sp. Sd200 TaxID=2692211 RepID=UPI00136BF077|nr:type II toxin-antitoxin system RelE/ParE family toxin [Flavobacterium sp. Sd200]MXN90873.1 type II toxin-antitoxin system RelE/ParE family toxin [Flavobacterium sp. Sd200]